MYTKQRRVFRNVGRRVPPRPILNYTPPGNLGDYLADLNFRLGGGGASPDFPYREFPGDKITSLQFEPNPVYPAKPSGDTPPSDPGKVCVYMLGEDLPNGGNFDVTSASGEWEYVGAVEIIGFGGGGFSAVTHIPGSGGDDIFDTTILPPAQKHVYLNYAGGIFNYHSNQPVTGFQYGMDHQSLPPTDVVATKDPIYKTPVLSVAGGGVAVTNWQMWVQVIGGTAAGTFTLYKKGAIGNTAEASARVQMEVDCIYFPDPDEP